MARLLAIDFGTKRTGIAVTDPLQLIASALTTIPTVDLLSFLKEYCQNESVERVIVGEPKRLNNEASQVETAIQSFLGKLAVELPTLVVERYDERFSSKLAFQTMIAGGLKKKQRQNKEMIDQISATIILQSYMEYRQNIPPRRTE